MTNSALDKLKPCPFCGGKAKYIYRMPYNAVQCTKCRVVGKMIVDSYEQQDGKQEVIKAWNSRITKDYELDMPYNDEPQLWIR